ncbi:MAG: O-antigen ligase family protein [Ignavibacteria bacterium]
MKNPVVKNENIFVPAKLALFLLIIAVPLAVTTLTHNQSDLPKNFVLTITAGLFCLSVIAGFCIKFFFTVEKSREKLFTFLPSLDIPVILLLLSAVLSTLFSINSYISYYGQYERQIGLVTFIYLFIVYSSISVLMQKEDITAKIVMVMEYTAAAISVYALMQQFGADPLGIQPLADSRPVTTIGNAVFAGGFLAMIFPLSLCNISEKRNVLLKILIPALIIAGIVVTRTRSAYLAVAAELIVMAVIFFLVIKKEKAGEKNGKKAVISIAVALALVVLFILIFPGNIFSQRLLSIFEGGNNPRWLIWRDAFGIFFKYPLAGPGIGSFPNAFAEFYSYELRHQDVMRYVDNAHNNYLQILFTMGTIGLLSYLAVLISAVANSLKNILKDDSAGKARNNRIYFAAILASLAGYSIYGLTNFDELTIMLYFTLLLVLIRSRVKDKKSISFSRNTTSKFAAGFASLIITVFIIYTSINVTNILYADIHFLKGERLVMGIQFKHGINEMNTAVFLQPRNPVYRYLLAENVYRYLNINSNIKESVKMDFLGQAADELIKARGNHSNVNECDAMLSLIYFTSGRVPEAEELKNKVLEGDHINIMYRLNLAYYYISNNKLDSSSEQLKAVDKINFQGTYKWFVEAKYHIAAGNKKDAIEACGKILDKEPNNKEILELKKKALLLP